MKSFRLTIILFFVLIYSVTSTGLSVKAHYCCGELKSVSLFTPRSCCGKSEKSKGCCHDETKYFKVKDSQLQIDKFAEIQPLLVIIEPIEFHFLIRTDVPKDRTSYSRIYDPPPLHVKTPIFIKNRVLII